MHAPFPYFGSKRKVASVIWQYFGNVSNYVEPFAGSLAVLLGNPNIPKIETVNDINCWLANFYRAIAHDPEGVTQYADYPINENDLHARHRYLVASEPDFRQKIENDPEFYDLKAAGWWVWGISSSVGNNWLAPKGLKAAPLLSSAGGGINGLKYNIPEEFQKLYERLKKVRVCCGDWKRVVTPSVLDNNVGITTKDITGVLLDPPYPREQRERTYNNDDDIFLDVVKWAQENENNQRLRIAVCGYDGEYFSDKWTKYSWKADGGMAGLSKGTKTRGKENAKREVIWFSESCIKG